MCPGAWSGRSHLCCGSMSSGRMTRGSVLVLAMDRSLFAERLVVPGKVDVLHRIIEGLGGHCIFAAQRENSADTLCVGCKTARQADLRREQQLIRLLGQR